MALLLLGAGAGAAIDAAEPTTASQPADAGLDELLEAGRYLWDEYAPEDIKAEYEFPSRESAEQFLADVERALHEGDFKVLATYERDARRALAVLRSFEGGDEIADWLQPRLDFLAAAGMPAVAAPAPSEKVDQPPDPQSPVARPYWDKIVVGRQPPARAADLVPRLKRIFAAEGVPSEWVWIAEVESSMNPRARSPAGARGLFQFMPATAERFGMRSSWPDERTDPEKSARAAAQYLRTLHGTFGSWPLAIAAYNAGEGRVGRTLEATGASSFPALARHLPAETRLYVPKVLATVAARESIADPAGLPAPAPRRR